MRKKGFIMDWSDFRKLSKMKSGKVGMVIAAASVVWFFAKCISAAENGKGIFFPIIGFIFLIGIAWAVYTWDLHKVIDPVKVWAKWDTCANNKPQIQRMKRAAEGAFAVKNFDEKRRTMVIVGASDEKPYAVTLSGCTCKDFKKRGLPCKHMYYLANRLGLQELPAAYIEEWE